ncbi:MAG: Uncharacterized protein Greene101449_1208, partial [Candidatus Peregrinibacteria bacterium Greene1014_49]
MNIIQCNLYIAMSSYPWNPRITLSSEQCLACITRELLITVFDRHQFFKIHEGIVCVAIAADEFIELHLHRNAIAVLSVLNEKNHEEGNDGGSGIDHELPSVAETEHRTGEKPRDNDPAGEQKCCGFSC